MKRYALLLFLFIMSCSKFEHTDLNPNPPCDLCDWASERDGVYSGVMYAYDNSTSSYEIGDTVTFTVDHVFLNQSSFDDSTRMYFEITETWQSNGNVLQWIGSALDSSGAIDGDNYYSMHSARFDIQGDSIVLERSAFGAGWTFHSLRGVFYR